MPKLKIQPLFLIGAVLCLAPAAHAQQIESLADASWQAHGRLGVGLSAYSRGDGGADRTSPFAYVLSGSLNLSYGDFAIPLSVTYRDQQGSLSNPFQYFGISPSYRWATLHLGHRSLPMGRYLLAGQTFLGVGLELNPGKFRFAALRGRLRTPLLQLDSLVKGAELFEPYHRNLTAVRVGIGTDANFFDLNVTRIEDRRREDADLPSDAPIPPSTRRRTIGSVSLSAKLSEELSLRGRYYNFSTELQDGLLVVEDTLRRGQQVDASQGNLSKNTTRREGSPPSATSRRRASSASAPSQSVTAVLTSAAGKDRRSCSRRLPS